MTTLGRGETKERTGKIILQECSWWAGRQVENNANQRIEPKYPRKPSMLKQVVKALIFVHISDTVVTISCLQVDRN